MLAAKERLVEIDVFRGIAILAMGCFHFLFDLVFFGGVRLDLYSLASPWFWLGRFAAVSFVGLAGVSLYLRFYRHGLNESGKKLAKDFLSRGIFIFGLGLLITVFTFVFFPRYTVWFGVLHLIGIAAILSIPLIKNPKAAGVLGLLILVLGVGISLNAFSFPSWLPIFPFSFSTFDYFPLFPWLGVFWLGIGIGNFLYQKTKPRFWKLIPSDPDNLFTRILAWLGRHSLLVYFVHQPILVAILALALGVKPF